MAFSSVSPIVLSIISEASEKLKRAKSTIYSDLNRNPASFPPVLKIPGSAKVLFVNVDLWLKNLVENQGIVLEDKKDIDIEPAAPVKKKRGRKSNAEKANLIVGLAL